MAAQAPGDLQVARPAVVKEVAVKPRPEALLAGRHRVDLRPVGHGAVATATSRREVTQVAATQVVRGGVPVGRLAAGRRISTN